LSMLDGMCLSVRKPSAEARCTGRARGQQLPAGGQPRGGREKLL
jgi:hypothetical protein